jgi:hypothetical protein
MARQPPQTPPTLLAELSAHINELIRTDAKLLETQIELERKNTVPTEPRPGESVGARVGRWLNGFAVGPHVGMSDGEKLHAIVSDRSAISLALGQLEQRRQQELGVQNAAAAVAATPAWLDLIRRVVLAAETFKSLEAAVIEARQAPGGSLLPHTENFGARSILAVRWSADPGGAARRALLKAGIISERDLEAARNVK